YDHERVRDLPEKIDRWGEERRDPLGALQRPRLRDQLAKDEAEVREDDERDQECPRSPDVRLEVVRYERLADRTEEDREHGDPDLERRDEPGRLVHQPQ